MPITTDFDTFAQRYHSDGPVHDLRRFDADGKDNTDHFVDVLALVDGKTTEVLHTIGEHTSVSAGNAYYYTPHTEYAGLDAEMLWQRGDNERALDADSDADEDNPLDKFWSQSVRPFKEDWEEVRVAGVWGFSTCGKEPLWVTNYYNLDDIDPSIADKLIELDL